MSQDLEKYLAETESIDYGDPVIREKADELMRASVSALDYIEKAYLFVRDEIPHSWDIKVATVSRCASDVLKNGTGICWTKSCLLAALLRSNGIPSGISYQRLTLSDEDDSEGWIIHALNTVYIAELDKWIRLDARGNKATVHAEFSLDDEKLAFPVRPEYNETDHRNNAPDLDGRLADILKKSQNILTVSADFDMRR